MAPIDTLTGIGLGLVAVAALHLTVTWARIVMGPWRAVLVTAALGLAFAGALALWPDLVPAPALRVALVAAVAVALYLSLGPAVGPVWARLRGRMGARTDRRAAGPVGAQDAPLAAAAPQADPEAEDNGIVVDGSNVAHWDGNEPRLDTLTKVVARLKSDGFAPQVFVDASFRHMVGQPDLDAARLAQVLSLPLQAVTVAPAGMQADTLLLQLAIKRGWPVLSNDRFRDRPEFAPLVERYAGMVVMGEVMIDQSTDRPEPVALRPVTTAPASRQTRFRSGWRKSA